LTGTVTVDDANVTKNIVFSKQSSSPPSPNPIYYTLTMFVIGNGTVTPTNQTYLEGTSVLLEAINAEGWTFNGWSGDATGTENTTIAMNRNKVVNATFTQNKYTLTIIVEGEGTIIPTSGTYLEGTTVSLEAIPAEGWSFSGWTGDKTATTNTTTIVMNSDKTVTATFTQQEVIPEFPSILLLSTFMLALSAIAITLKKNMSKQPCDNSQKN
jgi:uncharacterized repeat protein (TIGR02543 family)